MKDRDNFIFEINHLICEWETKRDKIMKCNDDDVACWAFETIDKEKNRELENIYNKYLRKAEWNAAS